MDEQNPFAVRAMRDEYFAVLEIFIGATRPQDVQHVKALLEADRDRTRARILAHWSRLNTASGVGVTGAVLIDYCKRLSELWLKWKPRCDAMPRFNDDDTDDSLDWRIFGATLVGASIQGDVVLDHLTLPFIFFGPRTSTQYQFKLLHSAIHHGLRGADKTTNIATALEIHDCEIGGQGVALSKVGGITSLQVLRSKVTEVRVRPKSNQDTRIMVKVVIKDSAVAGICDLSHVKAMETVNLDGTVFTGPVLLNDSDFREISLRGNFKFCPRFFGTKLPSSAHLLDMRLDGCEIGRRTNVADDHLRDEYAAVRYLRIECQGRRWLREEALCFAEEQRLERRLNGYGFERALSALYDIASVYGSSVTRAGIVFLAVNIGFGLLYWFLQQVVYPLHIQSPLEDYWYGMAPGDIRVDAGSELKEFKASLLALQNVVNPFGSFSAKALVSVQSVTGLVLSAAQVVGSLSLLAVFLLALRGRFQKSGSGGGAS
jgi:hypothetical protein